MNTVRAWLASGVHSDDMVEGGLVEAGNSVFLGDRVVDPGAGCGEGEDH